MSIACKPSLPLAMKTSIALLLALLTSLAAGEEIAHRAKIEKLEGQVRKTPQFQISVTEAKPAVKPRHWIEIEAEVEVETTDPSGFIPELEAHWFAVIRDKHNDNKAVRLSGRTIFKNIRTADKKVHLSAYIEPDTLERLTGSDRPSENDIEGYALVLSGPGIIRDKKYAQGLAKATAKEQTRWWMDWPGVSHEGWIVPKSRTPFAPLWSDRYPTEKPLPH